MASTRNRPRAERVPQAVRATLLAHALRSKRVVVALSGGVDSVVLLHALREVAPELGIRVAAVHVDHALSPNAGGWSRFCRALCRRWQVPLTVRRVRVVRAGAGLEAAARNARYEALCRSRAGAIALAHQLDDQAETVLLNLLRGAGLAGARGMPVSLERRGRLLIRPLLELPRERIMEYARANALQWVEDETNDDVRLKRNFLRHRVAPRLAEGFPRWREQLARAARHFASADADGNRLLRTFLAERGLRAPSESRLAEMLRQITGARRDARVALRHDGTVLRVHRDRVALTSGEAPAPFSPVRWNGERRLALAALRGELRFRRVRGDGIDPARIEGEALTVRLRSGGERLQPDARRPRRTLKNLFQEAGVPAWERGRLPLLFCGRELVWAPGLGVDRRFRAGPRQRGFVPQWCAHD